MAAMNPFERILAWIWDPFGRRRDALVQRAVRTANKRRRLQHAEQRALDQVKRTQQMVTAHREEFR